VPAEKASTGYRFRIADLYAEEVLHTSEGGLRRGPRRQESLSQDVVRDIMWVFNEVCLFAEDHGVEVPEDRKSLEVHRTDKAKKAKRQPISFAQTARIASQLHAVHQVALFLMRVLGLRISEAYGIRVSDITDLGTGRPGISRIKAQGGRRFRTRDTRGAKEVADHKEELKTTNSYRVLVVPPTLMALLRLVIAVFHTDADGVVRASARLIPGLKMRDAGGQSAFRTALAAAANAEGIDCSSDEDELDGTFSITPHDMRRAVMTDLDKTKIKASHAKRFAGHAAGADVHHRNYVLDDPELRPMRRVAKKIEKIMARELPAGLAVPTTIRCTTGNQPVLASEAFRIDAELVEFGWLVLADVDGEPMLSASEVTIELGVTTKTARIWMEDGRVPSVFWTDRANGEERRSRLSDVNGVRDRLRFLITLRGIAEEVDQPYHTVYQYVRAQGLELERHGERDYVVPTRTAGHLRGHYARQAELHTRAVPLSAAASTLSTPVTVVKNLITDGVLTEDDRAHDGRRMVTRDSLECARAARKSTKVRDEGSRTDLITWGHAREATGLSDSELDTLVAAGVVVREQHQRRRHVTRTSLLRYLVEHTPEKLVLVGSWSAPGQP
jgi:integrase